CKPILRCHGDPGLAVPLPHGLGIVADVELQPQLLEGVVAVADWENFVLFAHRAHLVRRQRAARVPVEPRYRRVLCGSESSILSPDGGKSSSTLPTALIRPPSISTTR